MKIQKYMFWIIIPLMLTACAGMDMKQEILTLRQTAEALRDYAIAEHLQGRISDSEYEEIKSIGKKFFTAYDLAIATAGVEDAISQGTYEELQNIMLDMRKKLYK